MGAKRRREDEEQIVLSSSSASEDGHVDSDSEPDEELQKSPPKRVRRASILPGFRAYNDAILASFDAVLLEDLSSLAHPNADSDSSSSESAEDSQPRSRSSSSYDNSVT